MAKVLTNKYQKIASKDWTFVYSGTTMYVGLRVYAKYNSQDKIAKRTYVSYKSTFVVTAPTLSVGVSSATARLDGTTKTYSSYTSFSRGETTLQEITTNRYIEHNDDGTSEVKTLSASWSASITGNASISGEILAPKMDLYPSITNVSDFNDEQNPIVTYTTNETYVETMTSSIAIYKASDTSFTTPLIDYKEVSLQGEGNVATYQYELTNAEKEILRNATIVSSTEAYNYLDVVFRLKSVHEGQIDYSNYPKRMNIVNANPTIGQIGKEEQNSKVATMIGSYSANTTVDNASRVVLEIPATAKKGASIVSVVATHGGATYSSTSTTSPYSIENISVVEPTINVIITDNRGNTTTSTITMTMLDYNPVSIDTNSLSIQRADPTSDDIVVNLTGYYQNTIGNYANDSEALVQWKAKDGSFNTLSSGYTISNNQITLNTTIANSGISYDEAGTFTIRIADRLTEAGQIVTIAVGVPVYDYGSEDFQINGDLYIADRGRNNPVNVLEAINGIVESGSNSNGYYTKFANGLMICYINEMSISRTGSSTLGSASVNYGTGTWTFPQTFVTPITCLVTARDSGSGVFGAETDGNMGTSTQAITCYGANVTYKVNALAIGMWK